MCVACSISSLILDLKRRFAAHKAPVSIVFPAPTKAIDDLREIIATHMEEEESYVLSSREVNVEERALIRYVGAKLPANLVWVEVDSELIEVIARTASRLIEFVQLAYDPEKLFSTESFQRYLELSQDEREKCDFTAGELQLLNDVAVLGTVVMNLDAITAKLDSTSSPFEYNG